MTDACCAPGGRGDDEARTAAAAPSGATGGARPATLIELAATTFTMGDESMWAYPGDGESPVHDVELGAFAIDAYAVSNEHFAEFVDATGFETEAERFGWAFVFGGLPPDEFL